MAQNVCAVIYLAIYHNTVPFLPKALFLAKLARVITSVLECLATRLYLNVLLAQTNSKNAE